MEVNSTSLAVVAAVNDDEVLAGNLAASPLLSNKSVPLIVERGHESAALAYNAGLKRAVADVVIFAHQDVYLPRGWDRKLLSTIQLLESENKNWGVLGAIGINETGSLVGKVWSTGLRREVGAEFSRPARAQSFDELAIVLRKETGLRFDANLPGFHLYGTDIVQSAMKAGFGAYVFNGPVVHNSLPAIRLGRSYTAAYRYLQRKWWMELPIYTTILPITRYGWPLLREWLSQKKKHILGQLAKREQFTRHEAPLHIAQNLGYEYHE